jgi:hypothetical protein
VVLLLGGVELSRRRGSTTRKLSNRQIAAVLGVDHETINSDRRRLYGENSPSGKPKVAPQADSAEALGENSPPNSSARAERITRDNRAEQSPRRPPRAAASSGL